MHKPNSSTPIQLVSVHRPRKEKLLDNWHVIFKNINTYLFFINQLVRINFLNEFKRSYIGVSWLFILPVLSAVVWIMLNGAGIIEPGDTGIPYPAYVLLSTSIWGFFVGIYNNTGNTFISGGKMKLMANFPYEVLLFEKLIAHIIRFVIPFLVNMLVLLFFGVDFTLLALLFPLTLIPLLLLGLTIGLIVSILRVLAVDVAILIDYAIGFLMFLTPVVYAQNTEMGFLSKIVQLNPLTYLIGFSRDVLTKGHFYEPAIWGVCSIFIVILFFIAVRVFMIAEPRVIERLIN